MLDYRIFLYSLIILPSVISARIPQLQEVDKEDDNPRHYIIVWIYFSESLLTLFGDRALALKL